MPQPGRKVRRAAIRPVIRIIALRIRARQRVVSVRTIVIHQQVHRPLALIVPVRRRALYSRANVRVVTAGASPGSGQARGGVLDKDSLESLVLEEAEDRVAVGRVGQDVHVDDVGGRVVNVRLGGGEGLEVVRVGASDLDVAWGACVVGVALVILYTHTQKHSWLATPPTQKGLDPGLRYTEPPPYEQTETHGTRYVRIWRPNEPCIVLHDRMLARVHIVHDKRKVLAGVDPSRKIRPSTT